MRFYQKAIATYDEGLKKYPKSFDLSYNKALLLYNITQDKRIVSQIGSLLDVLKEALDAHRHALGIDQENADVLFNTAQVLTSFAEELHDEADEDDEIKSQAIQLLQEAVELFNSCLTRQEMEYSEMQELMNEAQGGVPLDQSESTNVPEQNASDSTEAPEEWATVKEPVTPSTLIETALAQLGSLSSLATIASPTTSSLLANIQEIAAPVAQKLPKYISLLPTSVVADADDAKATPFLSVSASASTFHATRTDAPTNPQASAKAETDLAIAVFTNAIAAAEYGSRLLETHQYYSRIQEAFAPISHNAGLGLYPDSSHVPILSAYADALIEFAENVAEYGGNDGNSLGARWTALETAQTQLTQATNKVVNESVDGAPSKAQLYLTRANVELMRRRLAVSPTAASSLKSNAKVLLKNAGVYYRGAAALSKQDGNGELESDATIRNEVIKALEQGVVKDDSDVVRAWALKAGGDNAVAIVDEMIEEGLLGQE